MRTKSAFPLMVVVLFLDALHLLGGRPGPAQRQPPERRQANMLMLRFQDDLASERWAQALAYCSDRVRSNAANWPTPKQFFVETMPVEHVLAQDFGCWRCGTNFYGLFVTLSDH